MMPVAAVKEMHVGHVPFSSLFQNPTIYHHYQRILSINHRY